VIELGLKGGEAFIDNGNFLATDFETSKAKFKFHSLRHLGNVLVRLVPDELNRAATVRRQVETRVAGWFRVVTSNN
jgi:hypothetical protein